MAYQHLAAVYDKLMQDTPYEQWLEWLEHFFAEHGRPKTIIDLGCGTGKIAIPLAKQGYSVTGVDLSAEMLAMAYANMRQAHVEVALVEQDMRELDLFVADTVISFCDSLSYLVEEDEVQATFQQVYRHLRPGGCFLFDVHSPYKILHVFANNTFTLLEDEVSYIWQCFCDPLRLEVEHELTFFLQQPNGLYQRVEEDHRQRAYQPIQMLKWLKDAGFSDISVTADFQPLPPQQQSERLFYIARKPLEEVRP
ncbi:class I SAM-dependent DNA methyltransferase [Brevibacillus fulvus]|uniref:SAM-dependent methyltransferase n=1 Tax=Brevibacillus fulvus TaxID=1125967 RepID=A0A939BP13_9BACL|nr:class I SAM-dependent methyltransferase [Brevibacillus fulvus]MBM7589905.1 SAM-dependent methyltransferase [Brevibacillus fulvus]